MRVELAPIRPWRHDLTHCLHTTAGVLVGFQGWDPVEVLGARWFFHHRADDVRREEYYFPCDRPSLFASLAPYHPLASRWHQPADAAAGWREVRAKVAAGVPVAVAVDNYHLPFRPAYRDVHTNHLLTVYGFDDEAGEALVVDPVPPAFMGAIPIAVLTAARDSANPVRHDRDLFFTANPIDNRWLEITVDGPPPAADLEFVGAVLRTNIRQFRDGTAGATASGLAGLRAFLDTSADRLATDPSALDEIFIAAGPLLAVTGLHAEFLTRAGRLTGLLRLTELARLVDRVAHHWAALRIAVATARPAPAAAVPAVRRRADALIADHELVVDELEALLSLSRW